MKMLLKTGLLLTSCLLVSINVSQAKLPHSAIKFAKGSYCGSYAGHINSGRILNIYLTANQEMQIKVDSDAYVGSVRDSKGNVLTDQGMHDYRYITKNKGNHAIRVMGDGYHQIEVCAY